MKPIKSLLNKSLSNFFKLCSKAKSSPKLNPQKIRKILVYAYTGLGNFILYTPTLRALKKFFPKASFTLLHGDDTGCHEVVSGGNLFDKYIVIKKNADWCTKIKWIYKIRKEKYDLIISEFHNNNLFMFFFNDFKWG